MDGKFWYIRYFQPPGVAEAALESNIEASLRMTYHVISADSPPGSWLSQTQFPSDTPMSRMFQVPAELPRWLSQEDLDYHVAQFRNHGFRGGLNWYRNIERNWHLTPQLAGARIRQPAHFIAGAEDDVLGYVPNWRDIMPGNFDDLRRIHLIEGAGHWLMLEKPAETTAEILRFLADTQC